VGLALRADGDGGGSFHEETEELRSVLRSRTFTRAPNLSRILSYVCGEYFEGRVENIKEYNIAVYALGRNPSFESDEDSIVRVEASRLRKSLQRHYAQEGADAAIQIRLADSGYVPRFVRRPGVDATLPPEASRAESAPPAPGPETAAEPDTRKIRPVFLAGLGVLVLVVSVIAIRVTESIRRPHGTNPSMLPAVRAILAPIDDIRIAVGSSIPKYVDSMGQIWVRDQYFTGGVAINRPDRRISGTFDPSLYRSAREGDFGYDIPLKPGVYELRLHFAEIMNPEALESDGSATRRFHIALNGKPLLLSFDITLDAAESNAADVKVFKDVRPADDGFLHLHFTPYFKGALLCGIEISHGIPGKLRPIRILTGPVTAYDSKEQFWGADRYFLGGRVLQRPGSVRGTRDPELYRTERFGKFSYSIPVSDGLYAVTMSFAESNFGVNDFGTPNHQRGGVGSRLFDVYCNGLALLKDFDIFGAAGSPNVAVQKSFRGLKANGQGKLVLSFVPVRDYATVRAIEVVDETSSRADRK
jgi:hypothetical protein